jgi:hypothetical protein
MKKIKAIETLTYKVALMENVGYYVIKTSVGGKIKESESITDYNTASFLFDVKLDELERTVTNENIH